MAERQLEFVTDLTGDLASKSVVASDTGLYFAQNMMYRHTISVFDSEKELVATIEDEVDLSQFGFDYESDTWRGAPVEAAFTSDASYAYVSNYAMYGPGFGSHPGDSCEKRSGRDPGYVYRVDTAGLEIDEVYEVGSVPKFLAVTPDDRMLLVANWCDFNLSVVDLTTGEEAGAIDIGRHPRGIAITGDSRRAYVAIQGSNDIAVVNLENHAVGLLENIGWSPRHLVLSPDDEFLYVTLTGAAGKVIKIDLATDEIVASVRTGSAPRSMDISADGTALYVVNYESNTMSKVRADDLDDWFQGVSGRRRVVSGRGRVGWLFRCAIWRR